MSNCSDDIIWQVINHQFCAFKITTPQKDSFCKNEYNVTGECSRATCPLANAKYATVRSVDGKIYLYMKTAERQHMPSRWWERIKLSKNYEEALKQIDERLIYWPSHLVDKCKQRLTRLSQIAIAERRMALKDQEREYTVKSKKVTRREATRERKALVAAKLEKTIEKELLERLKSGAYGDKPLNVDEKVWSKVLKGVEETEEMQEDEQEEESEGEVEFVEDLDEDEDDVVDMEDLERWLDDDPHNSSEGSDDDDQDSDQDGNDQDGEDGDDQGKRKPSGSAGPKPKRRRGHVEIEYEHEDGVRV